MCLGEPQMANEFQLAQWLCHNCTVMNFYQLIAPFQPAHFLNHHWPVSACTEATGYAPATAPDTWGRTATHIACCKQRKDL